MWSWEIIQLQGAVTWTDDDCSVILDIDRREVGGWLVAR
jgi:hypothetical protein